MRRETSLHLHFNFFQKSAAQLVQATVPSKATPRSYIGPMSDRLRQSTLNESLHGILSGEIREDIQGLRAWLLRFLEADAARRADVP